MPQFEYFHANADKWQPFPKTRDLRYSQATKKYEWTDSSEYQYPENGLTKLAEIRDSQGDYEIVGGTDLIVAVREVGKEDDVLFYRVSGESVPVYTARCKPITDFNKFEIGEIKGYDRELIASEEIVAQDSEEGDSNEYTD